MRQANEVELSNGANAHPASEAISGAAALRLLSGFVRRHLALAFMIAIVADVCWAVYVVYGSSSYVATAKLVVNPRSTTVSSQQQFVSNDAATETSDVQTQVDILKSEEVARKVISDLNLTDLPEFSGPGRVEQIWAAALERIDEASQWDLPDVIRNALATLSARKRMPEDRSSEIMRRTLKAFRNQLKIAAVVSSHLIDVNFSSSDPVLAAKAANATADALINIQLAANFRANQKATAWSQERLQEMRTRLENAQRELVQFRGSNDIRTQVALRDIEGRVQSIRRVYDGFLRNEAEAAQQQSFPIVQPNLIAPATPPLEDKSPKGILALTIVTLGGAMAGLGIGVLRDIRDSSFHTPAELEGALGVDCIALVPMLRALRTISFRRGRKSRAILGCEDPRYIEALRGIELAAGLSGSTKPYRVIGFASALAQEGKSTLTAALAQYLTRRGERVLLIDCDVRDPRLTRELSKNVSGSLCDVLGGSKTLDESIAQNCIENLDFLPARSSQTRNVADTAITSKALRALFEQVRARYGVVLVDLPPLAPVVDARAIADLLDAYILVVEWGQTSSEVVEHALRNAKMVHDMLIGVVLNKVNFNRLDRYDRNLSKYYADDYFTR